MVYKSQFQKIDPYDWFCGPGSHFSSYSLINLMEHKRRYFGKFIRVFFPLHAVKVKYFKAFYYILFSSILFLLYYIILYYIILYYIILYYIILFYFDSMTALMYSILTSGYCIVQHVQCIFILWKTSSALWIPRCMHKSSSFNTDSFLKYRASIIDQKWGSLAHSLFVCECGRCVDAAPCMLLNYKEPSQSSGDKPDLR